MLIPSTLIPITFFPLWAISEIFTLDPVHRNSKSMASLLLRCLLWTCWRMVEETLSSFLLTCRTMVACHLGSITTNSRAKATMLTTMPQISTLSTTPTPTSTRNPHQVAVPCRRNAQNLRTITISSLLIPVYVSQNRPKSHSTPMFHCKVFTMVRFMETPHNSPSPLNLASFLPLQNLQPRFLLPLPPRFHQPPWTITTT